MLTRFRGSGDHGECDSPLKDTKKKGPKQIRINQQLRGRKLLDALIHEMTHAGFWHIDEEYVEEFATDLAREIMPYIELIATEGE